MFPGYTSHKRILNVYLSDSKDKGPLKVQFIINNDGNPKSKELRRKRQRRVGERQSLSLETYRPLPSLYGPTLRPRPTCSFPFLRLRLDRPQPL